jgi:hypothetical protein
VSDKNRLSELFSQSDYTLPPHEMVIGAMPDPERFDVAMRDMPLSTNIEDRRMERYPRRWAVRPQYRAAGDY